MYQTGDPSTAVGAMLESASYLSTIVVTFVALLQFYREWRRVKQERDEADSRASAMAYRFRRQLLTWIGDGDGAGQLGGWVRSSALDDEYDAQVDAAEQKLVDLSALTSSTSSPVALAIDDAYVLFFHATQLLYEAVHRPPETYDSFLIFTEYHTPAWRDLRECVGRLERTVIDPRLLKAERELAARRAAGIPSEDLPGGTGQDPLS